MRLLLNGVKKGKRGYHPVATDLSIHCIDKFRDGHARRPKNLPEGTPIEFAMERYCEGTASWSSKPHMAASSADNLVTKKA